MEKFIFRDVIDLMRPLMAYEVTYINETRKNNNINIQKIAILMNPRNVFLNEQLIFLFVILLKYNTYYLQLIGKCILSSNKLLYIYLEKYIDL